MTDIRVPPNNERHGNGRQAVQLVGREAEMDRIHAFISAARTGGGALLVTGEPGVGKTGLLLAASDAASAAGMRVIRAAGSEFEADTSFSALNQVLLPVLDAILGLQAVHRDALNVALGFGDGPPPSRLVVSNATLVLLREAATTRPTLVVIDDLPWLDRASAGVLSFVSRRLDGSNVGMLGASRTGEAGFFEHAGLPEMDVQRLDEGASRDLLDSRFPDLASTVRDRILVEAQGNPLALLELPTAMSPRMRASAAALPAALPLGRRLQALYRSRIAELPRRTRWLLLLMALDGTGEVRVLEAGGAEKSGGRDLGPAEDARLAYLDETTHRLAFHHPLIRTAIVEFAQSQERREAHRVLAEVWENQPERCAWHLAEATVEPDESVAAQLEAAAARILARGDAVGCVKALTRSADLTPGDVEKRRRLAAAAYIGADVAGDLSTASHVLAELRTGHAELKGSLQAAIAASSFLLWADGDVATAHRLLAAAIDARPGVLHARDPVIAEALTSLMVVCSFSGDEEVWRSFDVAMARAEGVPLALALNRWTYADPTHTPVPTLQALDSAIAAIAEESDPAQIIRIGQGAAWLDRIGGFRDALWRVVGDARRGGAVASGIIAILELAYDDAESGQWDDAERLVDEAIGLCEAHGYQPLMWLGRFIQGTIAASRGDDQRAEELAEAIVQWGRPRGMQHHLWWASQIRGAVALGRGDFEKAYQQLVRISPPGLLPSHVPYALRVLLELVEAAIRTGRYAEAVAHVTAMQNADVALLSARLGLVVGGCAAMTAPDDQAREIFEVTLALPGIERWQFDLAHVRLAYGERLRRIRSMVQSRVQLNAALAIFERLGARPWVERTAAELRATGLTKPHAGDNVLDRLTPQEFEIVTLAASGMTNKQIAERLFLSHRTIGGHLHRAFPKLGVSTRAALRDALQSLPPEQRPLN
jgi:DNA-binding CsgD family transcriptional regulator